MEDEALVLAFQSGDSSAFDRLFHRYKDRVLRTAFLITGNHCDSENVLQESFIKVWGSLPALKDPARFRPWLWRIVTRTAWQYCRRRDVEQPVEDIWEGCLIDSSAAISSLDVLMQAESRNALLKAVNSLSLQQRTVIILHYYNDMSVQEIAAATGTLSGTVKSRLFAARRKLRQSLADSKYFAGEDGYDEKRYGFR